MSAHPLPALSTELAQRIGHTTPGRLLCHAQATPERAALVEKYRGIWRQFSWAEYREQVGAVMASLQHIGLQAGDSIAILSDNRPEWLFAELGAQIMGALSTGIYQTNPPADVAYVIQHSNSQVVICEDQEQVDKVLEMIDDLPMLRQIVVLEARGTRDYDEPRLIDWEAFLALGADTRPSVRELEERAAQLDDREPCMIIYTSGTTGPPKGALLCARNVIPLSDISVGGLGLGPDDKLLSYLPLCHLAEKLFSIFLPLATGSTVHFGESIETISEDLSQVSPTVFLGVPRIWEKLNASISVRMQDASWLKRTLYERCLALGVALDGRRRSGQPSPVDPLLRWLTRLLVFNALRERLGLRNCRIAVSGAAPIAPELLAWFGALDLEILEGFGMTETAGVTTLNLPGQSRLGTVGRPVEGVEARLGDDGELQIRGDCVFCGYLNNEEATRETIDEEGWLHTGDLASVDEDGFFSITGRKKEIFITAGGKNISPNNIENTLKTSPYIKEVASIGDARPFVGALIQIDLEMTSNWAMRKSIAFTSFADLSANPQVVELIQGEVQRLNENLARVEQVRKFRLLPKELHEDDGEVTATQKLRRKIVYEKFAPLVDEIYGSKS